MTGPRRCIGLLAATFAAIAAACDRAQPVAQAPAGPSSTAVAGPVQLTVTADRDQMRTVDRLTLTLEAIAEPGVLLQPPTIDAAEAGWTLIARADEPLKVDPAARTIRTATLTLEPFLAGDYTIPPASVSFTDAHAAAGAATTEPIAITVRSVLDADDATLAQPRALLDAPPPPARAEAPITLAAVVASAGLAALALCVWLAIKRARTPRPAPTALDDLRRIAAHPEPDPHAAYAAIARALAGHALPPAARALADEADRVRYGRAPATPRRAGLAAREALDLLTPGARA